eukprot:3205959-Rhodomonas_salina.1
MTSTPSSPSSPSPSRVERLCGGTCSHGHVTCVFSNRTCAMGAGGMIRVACAVQKRMRTLYQEVPDLA